MLPNVEVSWGILHCVEILIVTSVSMARMSSSSGSNIAGRCHYFSTREARDESRKSEAIPVEV